MLLTSAGGAIKGNLETTTASALAKAVVSIAVVGATHSLVGCGKTPMKRSGPRFRPGEPREMPIGADGAPWTIPALL